MRSRPAKFLALLVLPVALGAAAAVFLQPAPEEQAPLAFTVSQRLYAQQASLVRVAFNDHQAFFALFARLWPVDPASAAWSAFGSELSPGDRAFANQVVLPALRAASQAPAENAVDLVVPLPLRWAVSGSPFGLPWAGTAWLLVRDFPAGEGGVR
ncbi:MAG TPA: hypothetical protein DEQ28_01905 [Clostridiales bacterium]|nr:hypothetical protein [Clostridiales bacterium]